MADEEENDEEEVDGMAEEEVTANPTDTQIRHLVDDEMRTSYINYAMSVIIGRALPEVRDGLKPVHRRVLFGMHEAGHTADRSYSKSARSVGEVMGKYHPHGDQSIYDTMVRMAQDFSLRYPLIDGQGNFGSIDGDPPAAMRYTESRLDRVAGHMLQDIDKNTVIFQPNFDDSENEPTVLPARLPNLLLNGSDGIAVGMATKIPPHNLPEVASAVNMHVARIIEEGIDKSPSIAPSIEVSEYMEHLKGPDFPTGAAIYGIDGIADMYATGHGRFHIRSHCEVFDDRDGKKIIITEIPYQVKKAAMLEAIAGLVTKDTITGIRDIRDESSKEGIRVVIEVKQNADPHAVLNQLYKTSNLQKSYSANMMGIIDNKPVLLTLSIIIHTYVRHREDVIERRTQFNLDKAQARAHILEGLVMAQERIDDVIKVGRGSASREQFENVLRGDEKFKGVAKFKFSPPQAKAIAERRLYQLSRLDVKKVEVEHQALQLEIAEYQDILGSRERRLRILLDELNELVEKHGDERRSEINQMPLSMNREDLIQEQAIVISISEDNYIRHLPVRDFKDQNRGGKGLKGVTTKDEDSPMAIITCFSKDRLLIFTDQGRVYGLKAWETPQASRHSRGTHIRNLLDRIRDDESIISILPLSREIIDEPEGHFLLFSTSLGRIKKTKLSAYVRINRNGKYAIKFAEGSEDSLISVRRATDDDHVILVTKNGRACRFKPSETKVKIDPESGEERTTYTVKVQGRISQGVRGIKPKEGDQVVGMVVTSDENTQILTITKYGMAKRTRLGCGHKIRVPLSDEEDGDYKEVPDGYRKTNRGGVGVLTMKFNDGDHIVSVRQLPAVYDENGEPKMYCGRCKWIGVNPDALRICPNCLEDDEEPQTRATQTYVEDHLFVLTKKGMMIRFAAVQTKETTGRSTKGTKIMELRNPEKTKHIDELIFTARLPGELVDQEGEIAEPLNVEGEEE